METFTTTAVLRTDNNDNDYLCAFGVIPEYRQMYGIRPHEQILSVTFEVVQHKPEYPNNPISTEYYAWCYTHELNPHTHTYEPLEHPHYSLIQHNALMFAIQFPDPVFKTQHKCQGGYIVRIRPLTYEPLSII